MRGQDLHVHFEKRHYLPEEDKCSAVAHLLTRSGSVLHFLLGEHALPLPAAAAAAAPAPPPGSTTYRKATPDRLCEAVSNYAELCAKYRKSDLAQFFTEPCSTPCRARADRTG